MNYDVVFIFLLVIGFFTSLGLFVVQSKEVASHFIAVCLTRTGVLAAGAVLVVVTVPLLSAPAGSVDDSAFGSFAWALLVVAFCLACEHHVALKERLAQVSDAPR